ncbi:MAG: hypothetical protein E7019_06290 [Alphaproteobacteria bacterium]|nr:hypothetical protein [Alphaproteobacteria bacterium]
MHSLMLTLLGILALTGVIRSLFLYLVKRFDFNIKTPWILANIATAFLRTLFTVPQLIKDHNIIINLFVLFVIYILEQGVWFVYDYIQQKRGNIQAGWKLIWGVIILGMLWLFILRLLTIYASQMIILAYS